MSGCHSWHGCSSFVPSLHGSGSTGRQCCCLSLPQAVSISLEPWVGMVWGSMVRYGLVPGWPPGWWQRNVGLSCCRLGHHLDCLKDMSAHSLALFFRAWLWILAKSGHPKWASSLIVSETLSYVNSPPCTQTLGSRQQSPLRIVSGLLIEEYWCM